MKIRTTSLNTIHLLSAAVWLFNGLFCKVLNHVPRHREIVSSILGKTQSGVIIVLIGLAEMAMAVWIVTGLQKRINVIAQIALVAIMNTLEFILVPELLLWGRWNAVFAFVFIMVIYLNEFRPANKLILPPC